MQIPEPQAEHRWLQRLVGEWIFEHVCQTGPDTPPMTSMGKQTNRGLGELWLLGEMVGEMPGGGEARSIITIGFDPATRQFVGSFVSSCMTHFWPYRGSLDASGKILTLDSEGPSFAGDGSMSKYQDIIEIIDDDHHTMNSQVPGPDGQWVRFMTGTYRRASANQHVSAGR